MLTESLGVRQDSSVENVVADVLRAASRRAFVPAAELGKLLDLQQSGDFGGRRPTRFLSFDVA